MDDWARGGGPSPASPDIVNLRDLGMIDEMERPVDTLVAGRFYTCRYTAYFNADATGVGFGMWVHGVDVNLAARHRTYVVWAVEAGSSVDARFSFDCTLRPGAYVLAAEVVGAVNGLERPLHRGPRTLAVRVESSGPMDTTALVDLAVQPSIVVRGCSSRSERNVGRRPRALPPRYAGP